TKISIISVYIPPYHSIHYKERDAIFAQLNLWLDKARSNNYHVIILGDFNADTNSHSHHLPQHHLKILRSLSSQYFTDHQSHISSISGPSPTFYHQNGFSRLDYIWSSPGFPAPGLFSHVESCPKLNDNQFTDHRVLFTAFDFSSCFAILAKARLKQKSEQRTIFLYKNLTDATWDTFSNEVNSRLELYLTTHHPSISSLSILSLDKLWHALKRSILGGAIDSLPFQHVSNTHHHKYSPELTMLIAINKFLDRLLFKLTTSRTNRPAQISQMINSLPTQLIILKSLLTDYTIPIYSTTPLPAFVKFLRSQKALVSAYLSTQFHQHRVNSIEYYTAFRDEHFSTSLSSFISSALSVEHRSIILDRVLVVIDSKPALLTEPSDIKQAAIKHFQSVVTPPLVQHSSIDEFPPRWQRAYTPISDIDSSLYTSTLALFKSFRFLGVWFCLSASSHFVHDQCSSMVKDMAALLSPKKLLAQHVAYLYNVVLLLRLEFRLQTTLFAESTINQLVSPMLSLIRQKAGFLDCDACPSTIDLEPWSHTFSLRIHSLFNSLLFSSRLKITWSLLFRFLRKDLRPAIPLQSILPKELFISMKNIRNNFGTHFLAQLVTLCGSRLLSWKDLRFLKRVSNKGSVPAWFTYLFNFVVVSNSSSFFVLPQFRIPNSHTVAFILSIDISRNYLFNPQWAISFNRNTNSFFVGRVIITYPAPRNEALISHWIASSVDDLLSEFSACQGCASAIPQSSTSKTLLKRCPSEKCFSYVPLSNLIRYPTKPRTYIHADTRSVSLSALLGYAKSLLLFHLFAPVRSPPINHQVSRISDIQLPSSVSILYIDGSFLPLSSHSLPSMAYAWTAIDSDGFIFESHYNTISSLFPSALRSEIFALLHGLDSLPRNSKITVATDCAQLISLWFTYVDASFIPRMLKESNHLLWSLARTIISQKNLKVTLIKVPAHADDSLNNYVDDLAKAAHTDSCLFFMSPVFLAPCILQFNSLPVDMNIRKFIGEIFDAKNLLTLALLPRFNLNSSISDIDWACTKHCFNNKQLQFSHRNGRTEFCAFRIKILLDMLPTLTTLQKRKPHIYDPSWPCP
ncbi:hypothetical protein RhiirA5_384689, partial [Rhizophagus irregularis]